MGSSSQPGVEPMHNEPAPGGTWAVELPSTPWFPYESAGGNHTSLGRENKWATHMNAPGVSTGHRTCHK